MTTTMQQYARMMLSQYRRFADRVVKLLPVIGRTQPDNNVKTQTIMSQTGVSPAWFLSLRTRKKAIRGDV
jgi:hypothetical protein